jgi:hypothetical protein
MRQHLKKGRGVPIDPPTSLSQHYIDLDTGEHYISKGTDYVTDWGGPLLDKDAVDAILNEFQESISNGEGLNSIVELAVKEVDGKRIVEINLPALAGRFITILDPTNNPLPYEIHPVISYNSTIRIGMEFKIFNNTLAEPMLLHENDVIFTSGSIQITPSIQIKGVVTIKHVAIVFDKRQWLVYGDTSRDSSYSATVADNAAKLDGFTREQIIAEARLLSENARRLGGLDGDSYQTDAEASNALLLLSNTFNSLAKN